MTWLEPQVAQYRKRHTVGTVARLALELLLNIAARRHDAHLIGQQHIKNGKLSWRPHKTLRTTGKVLSIRILPSLQEAIDAIPGEARGRWRVDLTRQRLRQGIRFTSGRSATSSLTGAWRRT